MVSKSSWLVALAATHGALASQLNAHDDLNNLKIVIYETGDYSTSLRTFLATAEKYGVESFVVGQGTTFSGFGSKYGQLKDTLYEIRDDPQALVAVIDGRDVLLNVNQNVDSYQFDLRVDDFIDTFKEMTVDKPEAVLMSAEQQCCVAALCHADSPSFYFDPATGVRTKRACPSGEEGCGWLDNANVKFWQSLMMAEAYANTGAQEISPYLNAGMMVGTAHNLINMIDRLDLGDEEDDQAVLTAMYIQFPHLIVLDYEQQLLGNNAWPKGLEDGCIYDFALETAEKAYLTNSQTGTSPLLLHTPGKFYNCLDTLIDRLGGVSDKRYLEELTPVQRQLNYGSNYGTNYGEASNYGTTTNYGTASNYGNVNYGNVNYGNVNYGNVNYGILTTEAPAAEPDAEPIRESEDEEPTVEELARLYKEDDSEEKSNNSALTWGISCAAAAAVIAGLATKRRQLMTEEQATSLKRAMENSQEAFSLGDKDPELIGDEPSVISSAMDSMADPDEMDFQSLEENSRQPFNGTGSFEDIPVGEQPESNLKSMSSPFDCDDVCGRNQHTAQDLRRHRTVHW